MTQLEKDTYIDAWNEFDTGQCMVWNNLVEGSIAELQSSGTAYGDSVSLLAASYNGLSEEDRADLCDYARHKTEQGELNKKVNTRPCEVR